MKLPQKTLQQIVEEAKQAPTPLNQLIAEMAEVTKKSEITVRRWIWGVVIPDALTRDVLAKHFGVDPDTLFPTNDNSHEQPA